MCANINDFNINKAMKDLALQFFNDFFQRLSLFLMLQKKFNTAHLCSMSVLFSVADSTFENSLYIFWQGFF
jgi:hypothetical protein